MKYAVVFPGQGSQSVGMLSGLAETCSQVGSTFTEASEALGYDLWDIVQNNPEDRLNKTEYTQPAMLTAGVAIWRIWQEQGLEAPSVLAGHSLGEYTALVAAGVLTFSDAVALVSERGRLMQAAVPEGQGAMAAVLGLGDDVVKQVCQDASSVGVVEAVNFNSPGQVVIAGETDAVNKAVELAKEAGSKRALLLPVSVPSHSSLMKKAAEQLADRLLQTPIVKPLIPVVHNVDAQFHSSPADITDALSAQLYRPVLWVNCMTVIAAQQANVILEFGPGKVLTGLCRRIDKSLQGHCVDSEESLQKALSIIKGE